ncbi:hypothetical protein P5V15_014014 [Pogonomyrmex californicus]
MYEESFVNYYISIQQNETYKKHISSHNSSSSSEPCTSRILGRFALTSAYKYLDIGINVGPVSYVELRIGDNRGNQILLPYVMWKTLIEKCMDIEQLVQSIAPSSLSIHDLVIELVQMRNTNIVKLTLRDTCLYIKPSTSDIFDKTSIIDCELLVYAIDNIVYYALHDQ